MKELYIVILFLFIILFTIGLIVSKFKTKKNVVPEKKSISPQKIDRLARIFSELEEINRDIELQRINYSRNWELYSNTNTSLERAHPNLFNERKKLHSEFIEIINEIINEII